MKYRIFIKTLGVSLLFAAFLVLAYTFILAYGNEDKAVMVSIDSKGEANIEMFILLPLTAIIGSLAFGYTLIDERKKHRGKNG